MFAWFGILNSLDYFFAISGKSVLFYSYMYYFSLPWFVCQTFIFFFAYRISYTYRAFTTFGISSLLLLLIIEFSYILADDAAYITVAVLIFLLGCNTSVLSASVMGLASLLPGKYIGALTLGMGFAGLIPCIVKLLTLWIWGPSTWESFLVLMLMSVVISLACIGAVLALENNKFAQYYFSASSSPASPTYSPKLTDRLLNRNLNKKLNEESHVLVASPRNYSIGNIINNTRRDIRHREREIEKEKEKEKTNKVVEFNFNWDESEENEQSHQQAPAQPKMNFEIKAKEVVEKQVEVPEKEEVYGAKASVLGVVKQAYLPLGLQFVNNFITWMMFPGVIIFAIHAEASLPWTIVFHCALFNIFSLLGNFMPNYGILDIRTLSLIIVARFVFFYTTPQTLLHCVFYDVCDNGSCYYMSSIFANSIFRYVNTSIFSFTHGYCFTCLAILAPGSISKKSPDRDSELEMAGHLVSCMIAFGMTIGYILCEIIYMDYVPFNYCVETTVS
ncbi:unnamed protein product [Blepharisma stoltei]|uniref:Uncharacterized protein n=1 Tax=Blepharisma stoltei TaxID=1481888 RepID=A0AAU9JDC7_9CILI|nr:unnamed protein product [Blepharisma stoltei]